MLNEDVDENDILIGILRRAGAVWAGLPSLGQEFLNRGVRHLEPQESALLSVGADRLFSCCRGLGIDNYQSEERGCAHDPAGKLR